MKEPRKIYSELEREEDDMLTLIAQKEDRPKKELIRHIIRLYVQDQVIMKNIAPVEGYVPPAEQIRK
jgi:hypothetical protein